MTGVEHSKASSWLRYRRSSVCMRQTTGPWWPELNLQRQVAASVIAKVLSAGSKRPILILTEVELAKASSWLHYSRSFACMRHTTGSMMAGVELAKSSSRIRYRWSFVCRRQTTGPVITEVELAKLSIWLRYSRGSICRKQMIDRVMIGVELRHTEGPRVASDLRHPEGPRVASYLFARVR
jgi:hypothetical protein